MRAQSWTDILTLLAVMVVTNKHEVAHEKAVFAKGAVALRNMVAPNMRLTEELAGDWLEQNRPQIVKQTSSVYYQETVSRLIKNLNILSNKKAILTALMKIALSEDAPSNDTEKASNVRGVKNTRLFERATESWELDLPIAC